MSVNYNKREIALNEYFTITLTLKNERLRDYSGFPDIEGFIKRGTSSSSSTTFTNGQMASSQSITQNYQAQREGTFTIAPFTLKVNGKEFKVSGSSVKVGPAQQQQQQRRDPFYDPFDVFRNDTPQEFIDVKADAFLALTTDKSEVYVGEGFTTTLAFYVAETNQANMRFYDLVNQLSEIVKDIKPANTWEENFNIDDIKGEPVTISGKKYNQFKLFQATYYPLNEEPIDFPSIDLKVIKYKVAKNPTFFGRNRQEDFETFSSRTKRVKVKVLPPHPLRDQVAVGNYRMAEQISELELQTGQSFSYTFNILGEGNISAIEAPAIPESGHFDIYAPNIKQDITRANGRVKGTKSFSYYGIPNEPGTYKLGDYFNWIFFNPAKGTYDTLQSRQTVTVTGESRKNEYIMSNDMGTFYDGIEFENNELSPLKENPWIRIFANILILTLLVLTALIAIRKKSNG
ncbi:BatD family protein [Marinoscillum sp. MHG1-6]|uniref:BatD family protein n=1 Tax=Marinoscillum sp. MHG1-6 TaxID=2959627 RepID=UPI0021586AAE|nr:BatD family protein [Marinoscillum sp. MHG1-6]